MSKRLHGTPQKAPQMKFHSYDGLMMSDGVLGEYVFLDVVYYDRLL